MFVRNYSDFNNESITDIETPKKSSHNNDYKIVSSDIELSDLGSSSRNSNTKCMSETNIMTVTHTEGE